MRPRATRLWKFLPLCAFLSVPLVCSTASAEEAQIELNTVQPRIVQPADETKLTVLKGNTHRLARRQFDQGVAPADLPMERMLLVLKRSPEQESTLRKLLDDQQDKASPNYHKWLTPEQFGKQFGPADQDMQVVTSWLQSHGFRIGQVAKGRNMIEFSGTAAQVQEALHTSIHKYVVNGKEHWANANDPQIPTALTPVVAGVHTLHNFLKHPALHFSGEKVAAKYVPGKPPEVTFSDGTHALGPADFGTIYNDTVGGSSFTIAVVGRSNLYQGGADLSNFQSTFNRYGIFNIVVNGPDPGDLGGGEEVEATLDSTWSFATSGASIDLVISASTNTTDGIDLSELYIVDNNLGDVMTESFSGCEAGATTAQAAGIATLAEQAAAQGITYLVSTGDAGAEGCDNPNTETVATGPVSVNLLASTPYTVAVGGSMFNENGQDSKYWSSANSQGSGQSVLSYIPENVWNESCAASQCGQNAGIPAGGGGASTFFTKPFWQSGVTGIPNDNARDLPDVSLTAAGHDPYLVCLRGSCVPDSKGNIFLYLVSGTSASTPSFAGIMAVVDQKMNSRQGQANYVLYKLAAAEKLSQCNASNTTTLPASTCIFNDVTVGNNAVPGEVNYGQSNAQYQSTVGYDLATGLGSVNVANLVNKWNTVTFKPTTSTILSPLNFITITHGQAINVNVTVTGNQGIPTGTISLLNNLGRAQSFGLFPLTAGSFSGPVYSFPGSPTSYAFVARYGGDGTFAAGTSNSSGYITVNPESSTTTLSVLGYPNQNGFPPFTGGPYGTFAYLRADVKGQSGFGTATGSVNFVDGHSDLLGTFSLNSEGNTATPNGLFTLPTGSDSVNANYGGDPSFNASVSAPVKVTITPASTTTTVTAQGTTLAATVTTASGGNPPTGAVTFFVDGAQVGSPVPVGEVSAVIDPQTDIVTKGASATASLTGSKPPSKSFKAVYNGDLNYVTSTSSAVADFTLSAGASTVTVASPGASGGVTLTVTAVDGVGSVQFSATSCAGLPSEAACSFSPTSIAGSGTTTLTITTKAATAAMLRPETLRPEDHEGPGWWIASTSVTLAGFVLLGIPPKRRRESALLSLIIVGFLSLSACGGGGGSSSITPPDPGTPTGSSTVVVTATSGSLKHTVNVTLTVK